MMQTMKWEQLLSAKRLQSHRPADAPAPRSRFQQDYDRIIFSSAFRRLQDKTQVFPLSESDYVRTRLTHSLEAGSVGRTLGTTIAHGLKERLPEGLHPSDVGDIVAAACLAHDIGNPPFGHSGEDAIRHWFEHSACAGAVKTQLKDAQHEARQNDFQYFEGNAQGFRILTRLQMYENRGGMKLTCATLGAFTKYPRLSSPQRAKGDPRASTKKFSFFHAEAELFAEVAHETGLLPNGDGGWCRHPLAFVVEAADDICYRLVDFEDGARLGLLGEDMGSIFARFTAVYADVAKGQAVLESARGMERREALPFLRAMAIGEAIRQATEVFLANEADILAGQFDRSLIDCCPCNTAMEAIIDLSRDRLYNSYGVMEIEAAGFEVIGGLLDLFVEAVEQRARAGSFKDLLPRWKTIINLIPAQFIGPGKAPAPDAYTRLLRITDYVSGMTDTYAVSLYKKLRGISLPSR